ncbi:glycosyltransferase family 2 protein [Alicyclobacillus fastidiosus]|uniref:Glycosyltransferase family 2 protein n=1 Tax=Alicyclobacillus fastidiosus TaxID=392011 RepID=A0ABV5AA99_9BACL|nr:glycosyltransferase family 2 protein [Alicyclobacillus fastidiosus]WEH07733.1 glycosyltransferase family 2 protein [Alicyclobacillus fastidiosus]
MTRYVLNVLSLMLIFVESFYLNHVLSHWEFVITGMLVVMSYGLFSMLNSGYSLAIAVTEVLAVGFFIVFQAWEYPGDLHIYVLNDNSTDNTGEIADEYANAFPMLKHIRIPVGFLKGKARVLNYGLSFVNTEYIAVYDADNQPECGDLMPLVEAAMTTPGAVGAVGYVKTLNESRNWLTRMIAIEFSVFQLLMQCGRSLLMNLGSFTGTNMIVSRQALLRVNGWDEYALAEDADLTMKLTAAGGVIPVVSQSRTWEQEPENFRVWFRQRTRWMQGNLYLIQKTFQEPTWLKGRSLFHTVQLLSVHRFRGVLAHFGRLVRPGCPRRRPCALHDPTTIDMVRISRHLHHSVDDSVEFRWIDKWKKHAHGRAHVLYVCTTMGFTALVGYPETDKDEKTYPSMG